MQHGVARWLVTLSLSACLAGLLSACAGSEEPRFHPAAREARAEREGVRAGGATGGAGAVAGGAGRVAVGEVREAARADENAAPEGVAPTPTPALGGDAVMGAGVVEAQAVDPALLDPSRWTERAPDTFAVELETTEGTLTLDVTRAWSPNGADRFYNLVRSGYFTDVAFFRVIEGFMVQGGIHGNPAVAAAWREARIPDDAVVEHNTRGMVSFATAGPGTRTTQFFINFSDNSRLDGMGFSPFARVRDMAVVDRLYSAYGEGAPGGRGPAQARVQREGNAYLRAEFPELDYIRRARVVPAPAR